MDALCDRCSASGEDTFYYSATVAASHAVGPGLRGLSAFEVK